MSREADFATRMSADATLVAILSGGIYQAGALGRAGLTRQISGIVDSDGFLKPCCLIKQRGLVPDYDVYDSMAQMTGTKQVVELWLYQDLGFTAIDAALSRLYVLFQGVALSDAFPCEWINTLDRMRDEGALSGASLARQDWQVISVIGD